MSGDLLRRKAVFGEADSIKSLLEQGANPCSVDDFGLAALHYAAWNGHVRCVEILCANNIGRDKEGKQISCIDLQSSKGLTPLHLAAIDGVEGVQCINVLLGAGADRGLKDMDGKTALDVAEEAGRDDCMMALNLAIDTDRNLKEHRKAMKNNLQVQRAQQQTNSDFSNARKAPRPKELMMYEDEIVPFSEK
ncbi:unnamed protein product, partial [Discosporangium mesarthrocarpum]